MSTRLVIVTAASLLAGAASSAMAQGAAAPVAEKPKAVQPAAKSLKVGDKAPALAIEKWVKGEPITGFEKGQTYVVEFWATWCGPCRVGMPHLSELQHKFKNKGVTIVGVNIWEDKTYSDTTLPKVEKFVKEQGDIMGYTVAYDGPSKTMDAAYMQAAGQRGIPSSFVVDGTGTIVYIGHPMWLDLPLEGVANGTWDAVKGAEKIKAAEAKMNKVYEGMQGDPKDALAAMAEFEKEYPAIAAAQFGSMKYNLLLKAGDPKASEMGRAMVDEAIKAKNAQKLNELAWGIVDPQGGVEKKDLDLALLAATKASEFSGEKEAAILDTLSRVQFLKGDIAKAVETQKKAVSFASGAMKTELEKTLAEYETALKK